VLIAYDRDDAGDRAAVKLAERLGAEGVECFRVLFPAGQDANAVITSVEDPAGALAEVLRAAEWLGAGSSHVPAAAPTDVEPVPAPPAATSAAPTLVESDVEAEPIGQDVDELPEVAFLAAQPLEPGLASPVPAGPPVGPSVQLDGEELRVGIDDRRWRVRGLGRSPRLRCCG